MPLNLADAGQKKEPINGVSQEFNDNVNNPNTELCFHCRIYKLKSEFTNPESGLVCDEDYKKMEQLINETGITFEEIPGRRVSSCFYGTYYLTDVYAIKNNEKYHLGGYNPAEKGFDLNHSKYKLFARKMQFLSTNGAYVSFYNHSRKDDLIEFIKWVKEINDNFGRAYDIEIYKYKNTWEFHGNLENRSCAFHYRICSEETKNEVIKTLSDPYYKNVSIVEA